MSTDYSMKPPVLCLLFLISIHLVAHVAEATYLPVPPPITCNSTGCTVKNYQSIWLDRKPCKAAKAVYPSSEAQLFQAVALASKEGRKMKMVSAGAHSLPKLVCPAGDEGVLISTQNYNSLIRVNLSSLTVTADAGVMLRDLLDEIAGYGLTLPHTPYWQGVSVAGMISTGAHGSGMWDKGSAPHDYVVGVRLIVPASEEEGYAKVVDLVEGDDDLDAARLSLGVLGAISRVSFQLEPMFKRRVSLELRGDEKLEDEILLFAQKHEFGGLNWYPASGKVLFKLDDRVSADTLGDGAYKLAILEKMEVDFIESLRSASEVSEKTQNADELCEGESMLMNYRHMSGDGLVNEGNTFTGYPVVGFNHKMQISGGCERDESSPMVTARGIDMNHQYEYEEDTLEAGNQKLFSCFWNPLINKTLIFFHNSISIPTSQIRDALLEIKKLRDLDPQALCSLGQLGGIWIRFQTKAQAYLGEPTNSVVFEFFYYRAKEPHTPRFHQDLFEEIEQMLVFKFGGKPHWGKNRDFTFGGMHTRTLAMTKFLAVMKRFDPLGLFSNEWTDVVLKLDDSSWNAQTFQDHCALEGLCVCREDSHCHPSKGYFCRPGLVYKEARVCRHEKQDFFT